jgi:hypothetical protein
MLHINQLSAYTPCYLSHKGTLNIPRIFKSVTAAFNFIMSLTEDKPDLLSKRMSLRNKTSTFGQEAISGHKSQSGLKTMIY